MKSIVVSNPWQAQPTATATWILGRPQYFYKQAHIIGHFGLVLYEERTPNGLKQELVPDGYPRAWEWLSKHHDLTFVDVFNIGHLWVFTWKA